jgi:hypothetical protein
MEMTVLDALLNDIDLDANDEEAISIAKSIEPDLKKIHVIFALFDLLQKTDQNMIINKLIDNHMNKLDAQDLRDAKLNEFMKKYYEDSGLMRECNEWLKATDEIKKRNIELMELQKEQRKKKKHK